jgi:hypothetical protein
MGNNIKLRRPTTIEDKRIIQDIVTRIRMKPVGRKYIIRNKWLFLLKQHDENIKE